MLNPEDLLKINLSGDEFYDFCENRFHPTFSPAEYYIIIEMKGEDIINTTSSWTENEVDFLILLIYRDLLNQDIVKSGVSSRRIGSILNFIATLLDEQTFDSFYDSMVAFSSEILKNELIKSALKRNYKNIKENMYEN